MAESASGQYDIGATLMDFAHSHQITRIVLGSSQRSRWQELLGGGSIVRKVHGLGGSEDIDVHITARRHDATEVAADAIGPLEID